MSEETVKAKRMTAKEMIELLGDDPNKETLEAVIDDILTRMEKALYKEFAAELADDRLRSAFLIALGLYTGAQVVRIAGPDEIPLLAIMTLIKDSHRATIEMLIDNDDDKLKEHLFKRDQKQKHDKKEDWDVYMVH